jgi:hypothetical protein
MPRPLAKPLAALLALSSFVLCPLSFAHALDPELTTPYKVRVVLRVAPNRLLTPIFKEQLRRDLQQGLQAALGAMGEVEVIDPDTVPAEKQEPLWQEVAAKGLRAGLDGPIKGPPGVKTHFVTVDYVDGQYDLQARQYDGITGLASLAVRHERTPDRQFVARTAALLVDRDFGLVGTVIDGGDGQAVRVAVQGGGLKVPLDRWVKKGDVFAPVQVGADGRTRPLTWALLQAEGPPGEDGVCACKAFLQPTQRPLLTNGTGLRCLKLGTVPEPVRLRVMEWVGRDRPARPLDSPAVIEVRRHGFSGDTRLVGVSDPDGFYSTEKEKDGPLYDGVAFVTVKHGGQVRAEVPLALVDDRIFTVPIQVGAEGPLVLLRREQWEWRLLSEQGALADLFKDLNKAIGNPASRAEALKRAREALDRLSQQIKRSAEERAELAKFKNVGKPLDLSKGIAYLQDLQNGRDELARFVTSLEKTLKEENTPEAQEARVALEQAHNLETEGDYEGAIKKYEEVLARTKDAKLDERLKKLKEVGPPKDDTHAKAREFIYKTWPKLEPKDVTKEKVKEAEDALVVCRKVKDPFGPRKLLRVALAHARELSQQLADLKPDINEGDIKPAKELDEVLDALTKLIKGAQAAVEETPVP